MYFSTTRKVYNSCNVDRYTIFQREIVLASTNSTLFKEERISNFGCEYFLLRDDRQCE